MRLGTNVVGGFDEWRTFRPFLDQALQAEPPWRGDWNAEVYATTRVERGVTYRARVGAKGSMTGGPAVGVVYRASLEVDGRALSGFLRGDVAHLGSDVYRIGPENSWVEFVAPADAELSAVRLRIIPASLASDPVGIWRPDLAAAFAPYRECVRVSGASGAESDASLAPGPANVSWSARWPYLDPSTDGYRWSRDRGARPEAWSLPGAKVVWVGIPLRILSAPNELIPWVQTALAGLSPGTRLRLTAANELWNSIFPQHHLMRDLAIRGNANRDWLVGIALLALRALRQLKGIIDAAGISDRVEVVFEWWAVNRWPFMSENGQPVCAEARALLSEIGELAIAPYFARGCREPEQLAASVAPAIAEVRAWRELLSGMPRPVRLSLYECGPEPPDDAPASLWRTPEMADASTDYVARLDAELEPRALACWYGFIDERWGSLHRIDDVAHPVHVALSRWVATR